MKRVTIEVPEGHTVKIVKEENPEEQTAHNVTHSKSEPLCSLNGEEFYYGDVIINPKDKTMCVLGNVVVREVPSLSQILMGKPQNEYIPAFLAAYVPINENDADKVFINLPKADVGIGVMQGHRHATQEEIKTFQEALLKYAHYKFNPADTSFEYIPTVGDMVIAWNDECEEVAGGEESAVIGIIREVKDKNNILLNDGCWYNHTVLFNSKEQYLNFISKDNE